VILCKIRFCKHLHRKNLRFASVEDGSRIKQKVSSQIKPVNLPLFYLVSLNGEVRGNTALFLTYTGEICESPLCQVANRLMKVRSLEINLEPHQG